MAEEKAETGQSSRNELDVAAIMKLIPHRYPFLLVDRIVEVDGDRSAIGIKNVTINEPFFAGHFPNNPVMPGVLIVEAMAQTAGAICVATQGGGADIGYFMSIESAKFRKPVLPGDRLCLHVQKLKQRGQVWKFACEGRVNGAIVAEATVTAMLASGKAPA